MSSAASNIHEAAIGDVERACAELAELDVASLVKSNPRQ